MVAEERQKDEEITEEELDRIVKVIRREIGRRNFNNLERFAFEWACIEADYLKLERKGFPFQRLCEYRRACIILNLYDDIVKEGFSKGKLNYKMRFAGREEVETRIREFYEGQTKQGVKLEDIELY